MLGDWYGGMLAKIRAINFHEGNKIKKKPLAALIRAAVALNMSK